MNAPNRAFAALALLAFALPVAAALTFPSAPATDLGAAPADNGLPQPPSAGPLGITLDPASVAVPGAPPGAAAPSQDAFGVHFVCPRAKGGDAQAKMDDSVCPNVVIDEEDLMGQPQLTIDPNDPDLMAFHALHGGKGIHPPPPLEVPPPTVRSRYNTLHQPHTTFQTNSGGQDWTDQRYYAMEGLMAPNRTIYGEDNAITIDAQGRAYLAALYSFRDNDSASKVYSWAVSLYKMSKRLDHYVSYYENSMLLHADSDDGSEPHNVISDLHLAYSQETNRVVVLWLEHRTNATGAPTDDTFVAAYRTTPGEGAAWEKLPDVQQVRGCRALTDTWTFRGQIFFGCKPNAMYHSGQNASVDYWQIHAIDPKSWTTRYVASTSVDAPYGLLVDMSRSGWVLFVGSGLRAGRPVVEVAQAPLARNWGDVHDYGADFALGGEGGQKLLDARVTAAVYTKMHGYLHTIYMEHYDVSDAAGAVQKQVKEQKGHALEFDKAYEVIRPSSKRFAGRDHDQLKFGEGSSMAQSPGPAYAGGDQSIFDDLHDGLITWVDKANNRERIFMAFGDNGNARFAEVVEDTTVPAPILPVIELPAIPVLAAASAPSSTGAVVIAMSALMLLRMLVAKKKAIAKAPSL